MIDPIDLCTSLTPNRSDLWGNDANPIWTVYLAEANGATQQQLVLAACDIARLCLPMIPSGDVDEAFHAIETTEAWCRGEATAEQVDLTRSNNTPLSSHSHALRAAYLTITFAVCAAIYDRLLPWTFARYSNNAVRPVSAAVHLANTVHLALLAGIPKKMVISILVDKLSQGV